MYRAGESASSHDSDDTALLAGIAAGDHASFALAHERYAEHLYRFAFSYVASPATAADIVQDVFVRVWERRATLRSDGALAALLFRMTRNAALQSVRNTRRRDRLMDRGLFDAASIAEISPADTSLEAAEERRRLSQAIKALPERTREAILLRWAHGLSYGEIAHAMGVSLETVKSQLARGLLLLRSKL
jgi:RNA polymerase sigma-70 factor (ECF subfamily)